MIKTATAISALLMFAAGNAYALQECVPGKQDTRIRYCTYNANQVFHLWTAPGAVLEIQVSEDEFIPEGNVMPTDRSRVELHARGNHLYVKATAKIKDGDKPCLVPEPLLFTTKSLSTGKMRPYRIEFETKPNDCDDTPAGAISQQRTPGVSYVGTANATPPTPKPGNLRYVAEGGLANGANIFYAAVFKYPDDEAAKRRAEYRAAHANDEQKQAQQVLNQKARWNLGNKFDASWNCRYAAHGNLTPPAALCDDGYTTVFIFPQMERVPSFYRWNPGAQGCNRNHDDHYESTAIPATHRSGADGDTEILPGTAQGWCLRDGQTVLEIRNLAYSVTGQTPATGTISPKILRTLKDEPQDEPSPVSIVAPTPPPPETPPPASQVQPGPQPTPQTSNQAPLGPQTVRQSSATTE
jgi:type IV secretion system protein VirB9